MLGRFSVPGCSLSAEVRTVAIESEPTRPEVGAPPRCPAVFRRAAPSWLGWCLAGVLVMLLVGQGLTGIDPQDEGQFLTYPWLIGLGRMPYRDVWMSYPPATYLLLVPLFKLGLPALITERALGLAVRLVYIALVNRLASASWTRFSWIGFTTSFSTIFLASDTKLYPWIVAMPLVILGLYAVRDRPYLSALLFFAAGLFRFEFAGAGLLALCAYGVLPGASGRRAGSLHAAGLLLLATVGFYAALNGLTGGAAFRDIFIDQIITVQRGRYIPLSSIHFGFILLPVLLGTLAAPPLLVGLGVVARRPDVAATNLAMMALLPHMAQRFDPSHLFSTAALIVPWSVVVLMRLEREHSSYSAPLGLQPADRDQRPKIVSQGRFLRLSLGATVGAWSTLITLAYGVYLSPLSPLSATPPRELPHLVVNGRQAIIADDANEARDDRAVIRYLRAHASRRDSLLILPASLSSTYTRTDLYAAIGLQPAGRYLEVQPNLETQDSVQKELLASLHGADWVLLVHGGRWYAPGGSTGRTPVDRYVRVRFHAVLRTETYLLLRHV